MPAIKGSVIKATPARARGIFSESDILSVFLSQLKKVRYC